MATLVASGKITPEDAGLERATLADAHTVHLADSAKSIRARHILVATGGQLWRRTDVESDYSDYAYFYDALFGYGSYFYDNNDELVNPNQYIVGNDRYRNLD